GYLAKQHPQAVAVVMTKLSPDKASNILALFEDAFAQDLLLRLSQPMNVSASALRVLSDTIEREFFAASKKGKNKRNPGQMIGGMLNNLPTEKRESLLEFMTENAPDIADEMKRAMLTFQDFAERVPAKGVAAVIREVDVAVFLKAVKFGRQNAPASVEFIFANISKRMAQQYEEQLEKLNKVTVKEAEAAQGQIMLAVRRLEAAGEIELNEIKTEGGEEEEEEDYL
ncbi:MAG: FliG C-terminal domain-containing protein, partial [Pseudomonadota bacterium]